MGDDPYAGIEMDDLLENLPDPPTPQVFTNVDVWQAISQYMNPLMAAMDKTGRETAELRNAEMIENEQLSHVEDLEGLLTDVDDTYMTFAEAARLKRSQRDSILKEVKRLHETMMFMRRMAGMRGRELYRHHRN